MHLCFTLLLVVILLICGVIHAEGQHEQHNNLEEINLSGDVVLGGLFTIHTNSKRADRKCSDKIDEYSEGVEAMLFAIDRINNDTTLLPGNCFSMLNVSYPM